ncbi:hypothetical protein GCM10027075_27970 [Streptomyces heilongjiangensis]
MCEDEVVPPPFPVPAAGAPLLSGLPSPSRPTASAPTPASAPSTAPRSRFRSHFRSRSRFRLSFRVSE